jgi:hypothetical protein
MTPEELINPTEFIAMPYIDQLKAYWRQQAAKCAAAAATTITSEVKEAYLNLERGWLGLAADDGQDRDSPTDPASMHGNRELVPSRPRVGFYRRPFEALTYGSGPRLDPGSRNE